MTAPYRCEHTPICECGDAAEGFFRQACDALNDRNRLRAKLATSEAAARVVDAQAEALLERAERAESALRGIQWSYRGVMGDGAYPGECPECGGTERTGHDEECAVGRALTPGADAQTNNGNERKG